MAGIGFELRKLLEKRSYAGLFQAYVYAGMISSGPWVLSIIGILLVGILSLGVVIPSNRITEFQVTVTYLMLSSLIFTGPVQLAFTRFVADRLFEKKDAWVLPNFHGLLILVINASGLVGTLVALFLFPEQTLLYRILLISGFVILCAIWVTAIFLSGMKKYKSIVAVFAIGYAVAVAAALLLRPMGTEGLLLGFVIGHVVLLMGMLWLVYFDFETDRILGFDLFRRGAMYPSLMLAGFFYNLGIWVDKIIFWFTPETSQHVIGPLRASLIYDLPVFLAYLSIIPGMAVFLVRIETDFVEFYNKFYDAVREGATLDHIERMRNNMVFSIRQGLFDIIKVQGIAILVVIALGETILNWLGISTLYLPLLTVDVIATGIQVVFLAQLNILFYLDKRRIVVGLTALFLVANFALTWLSIRLGPAWFGYGFALALLITVLLGMDILRRRLDSLEYETFMLQ